MRDAIKINLSLPATTVEAERSFSCMRRVKTWQRSTMSSDRLSELGILYCHKERLDEEKIKRVVASMASGKRRRLDF